MMKNIAYPLLLALLFLACRENKKTEPQTSESTEVTSPIGHWDNFQQFWLENTATDIHRMETDDKHRHLSMTISKSDNGDFMLELREGRNGKHIVANRTLTLKDFSGSEFKMDGDTLIVSDNDHFKNKDPYKFIRSRKFSGWIEVPITQYKDSIYRKSNLEIHDQGGMAELQIDGIQYTAELTQLLFGQKLAIMKLAIYDMPLDSVQINSRSISYTWLNPEAKRTGINLRKITSGWTLIEPGYINSDNTKFGKK